jgi:rhomboid protease GluP
MSTQATPHQALADRLVSSLLAGGCTLRAHDAEQAVLSCGNRTIVILQAPRAFELLPNLGQIGNAEVVILGGKPEVGARLKKSRPWLTQGRVHLFHIDDDDHDGGLWKTGFASTTTLGPLLERRRELPEVDPDELAAHRATAQEQHQAQVVEVQHFHRAFGTRTPWATYALAAIIGVYFALELLWGGSDSMPTLVRMGALVRERALVDEPWRLLSCTFLHAGFMHFAFNVYVLLAIGISLERILGAERFLVLYVASALGGSLASTLLLGEGISVGASGAIWGLLAAEAVLAYRPAGLLPSVALPQLKRAALINLGINVANSFRPEVDWAAHFGGGVVGSLLIVTGLLTLGLPRLAELSSAQEPVDRKPGWLRSAAIVLTGALLVGGASALIHGAPWALSAKPELTRRPLGTIGLGIELPATLTEPKDLRQEPGKLSVVYGDLLSDMVVADVFVMRFDPPLSDELLVLELEGLEASLAASVPSGATPVGQARQVSEGSVHYSFTAYRFENGLLLERAAVLTPSFGGRVDFGMWPQLRDGYTGMAERAARSIAP